MADKPIYLVKHNDPVVARHTPLLKQMIPGHREGLHISVEPEVVHAGKVMLPKDIIKALQHFPKIIGDLVFNMHFYFVIAKGSEEEIIEESVYNNHHYMNWFAKLGRGAFMVFFMKDHQSRLFCLREYKDQFECIGSREKPGIRFSEEENTEAFKARVFYNCVMFYLFCHGSKYNPQPAIESLLSEFNQSTTFYEITKAAFKIIRSGGGFNVN